MKEHGPVAVNPYAAVTTLGRGNLGTEKSRVLSPD